MSVNALSERSGGVIGTIGPIGGKGVWSLRERGLLAQDFYDDVSLYLKMNGANGSTTFYDSSKHGHVVTANGNAQISTAQSKFGGASGLFDGNGDALTVSSNAAFGFGTGDFTYEAWIFPTNVSGANPRAIASFRISNTVGTSNSFAMYLAKLGFSDGVIWRSGDTLLTANQWYHAAVTRQSGTIYFWLNGILDGTFAGVSGDYDASRPCTVGQLTSDAASSFPGHIDDLRITKGRARYVSAYTPPQRQFRP